MLLIPILTLILAIAIVHQHFARKKLPRGPTPLPFIGNLHQFAWQAWKLGGIVPAYHTFAKQYGKVFTLWIGPLPTVYISDYDIAHESHIKRANTFGVRYVPGALNYIREGRGILTSNGEFWQEHRRFAMQTLRRFGLGRNIMEERIMEEYRYRLADFTKTHTTPDGAIDVDASTFFDLLIGSIVNQILASERYEQNDETFEKLRTNLAEALERLTILETFLPLNILLSPLLSWRTKKVLEPFDYVFGLVQKSIDKRVQSIKNHKHFICENGEDFIDAYLLKIENDEKDGVESSFNLETMAIDLHDLIIGGQETTSTTLTWACACLLNHPEVVKKLRAELVEVTGGNRPLSLTDKFATPYLNAVINEVQRIASILAINVLRITEEDTTIGGQPLRARTAFTTQLSMIHTDEELFKNPKKFDPSRFLENQGLEKKLIPFGIGKRACPGESLARAELYLILGNLVLEYDLKPSGKVPKIETISPFSMARRPPNYRIRFVPVK